ncbi:LTA synthase family protein [Paenibacillus hamazuiensis]|uniref:LTA synthase family protein n=1 Tax=Paenibacillus hamazuiensis TaxID=2936508 RepID=UPI00200C847D|nr:alkaline phosphatase family protein [Paenibacillus hamazuiensis]
MKRSNGIWSLLLSFLTANVLALSLQYASLKPFQDNFIYWINDHKPLYALSVAILFAIILGLDGLFNNTYFAIGLATAAFGALTFSQYHKLELLGEPIYPWDLNQLRHLSELMNIARNIASPGKVIAAIVLAVLILIGTLKIPGAKKNMPYRICCIAVFAFTVFFCFNMQNAVFAKPLSKMGVVDHNWNQKENYLLNGFMIAFLQNFGAKMQNEPPGYSEAAVEQIAQKYSTPAQDAAGPADKPNIVYVMDESLFDPTRLSGITFSEDPMSSLHKYQETYPSGYALSPMFGGGTSNVEFEALTGLSMSFLTEGATPYQQLLVKQNSFPSIVSILKSQGYNTTAVHPFDGTFYNRNRVYPTLGFDRFITQDDIAYKDKLGEGGFISDMSAVKQVVDVLHSGDGPQFVHLVTMQNHLPIQSPDRIAASGLSGNAQEELESYSYNAAATDKAIQYLVDSIQDVNRPTIVLVFGDHLPALDDATFQKGTAGMSEEQQQQFMHETPLLVAANFHLQQERLGTVSPSFFGPLLFRLAGLQLPPFYQMLETVRQQLPGLTRSVYIDKAGQPSLHLNADQQELLRDYQMVQYDLLYGKRYALSMFENA